jgi:hypothetical protein
MLFCQKSFDFQDNSTKGSKHNEVYAMFFFNCFIHISHKIKLVHHGKNVI